MLARPDAFRAAAILVLIAALVAGLAALNRRPAPAILQDLPPAASSTDDLAAELRRCGALGPQDAEDARCTAVWEENRRRFFGRPARPLSPKPPGEAAPATRSSDDAR